MHHVDSSCVVRHHCCESPGPAFGMVPELGEGAGTHFGSSIKCLKPLCLSSVKYCRTQTPPAGCIFPVPGSKLHHDRETHYFQSQKERLQLQPWLSRVTGNSGAGLSV